MKEISEGKAKILVDEGVFYNPKMTKLRDISVLFLKSLKLSNPSLLDATSATGIRAIRYAKEVGIKDITVLDINESAYKNTATNLKKNGLKVPVLNKSIQEFANTYSKSFDIIDLDPFGTPIHYVYDLLKLCTKDTVLMVTATDTAVLCGAHQLACMRLYGSKPLHNKLCKEVGIRILINYFARAAAQFNFGIEELLSISDMHYMRIFLRLKRGANEAKETMKQTGFGSYCGKCHALEFEENLRPILSENCKFCGNKVETFGPLWLGRLYDKGLINNMIKLTKDDEIAKQLKLIYNELDTKLFYYVPRITKDLKIGSVSSKYVMEHLKKRGYKASYTQFEKEAIKTNAPAKEVIRIVKRKH